MGKAGRVPGPCFPSGDGSRAGERKKGKISYAKALRDALWAAGVVRALPGFHDAAVAWQRVAQELKHETSRPAKERIRDAEQRRCGSQGIATPGRT